MEKRPLAKDVGLLALELYFPSTYVDQGDLELYDNVARGKYTLGLGQLKMACVNDREDVTSISLTCVRNLLTKHKINPRDVGRLEVGTETLLDKAKSVKTNLMGLFKESGNHDIEGVTSVNACYGGTNALFNTLNWVQSNAWDGRLGIVLCTDVAVYPKGNARPTGGCGAVAMLIGPNAPLVFEDVRSTFIDNNHDFYKPNPHSEYPTVDGHLSISIYLGALANCYEQFKTKYARRYPGLKQPLTYHDFDFFCFHTPFSKMVQKAFYHLVLQDILTAPHEDSRSRYPPSLLEDLARIPRDQLRGDDPNVTKVFTQHIGKSEWQQKCERTLYLAKNLGNIYTGSLYNGLLSLLGQGMPVEEGGEGLDLRGKKVMMFSYGSGCAASMFMVRVSNGWGYQGVVRNSLFKSRLESRIRVAPEQYDQWMSTREQNFGKCPITPQGSIDHLFEGTYYLTKIDEKYKRYYAVKGEPKISITSQGLSLQKTTSSEGGAAATRLNTVKQQLLAQKNGPKRATDEVDSQVLRSVVVNFHKKPVEERLNELNKLYPSIDTEMLRKGGLSTEIADYMIENCIGIMPLPLGLGLGFKVNGRSYTVPMALEEPSVIAACSAIAKLISEKGSGFTCQSTPPVMIAQIQVTEVSDYKDAQYKVKMHKKDIIKHANLYCENMVKRGGGVEDIRVRVLGDRMIVVELLVNVCDSMGANVVNTIAELTSPYLMQVLGQGRPAVRILSNLCTERLTMAEFRIAVKHMGWKGIPGEDVVDRIIEAQRFAELDQYRATTHNKGIMNGIDAVAVALGQDWRAIEAAAHSYAAIGDRYMPLTRYKLSQDAQFFEGRIELPLSVGTKGGAIETNPSYINTHSILGFPSSQELGHIMASVGLAQNLAAIRALSTEGIQRGHMNLHARNVAIQAGVPQDLVPEVVEFMKLRNKINVKAAQHYLNGHTLFKQLQRKTTTKQNRTQQLSTFYVEIRESFLPDPLILTILLDCKTTSPYHLSIEKDPKLSKEEASLMQHLFGGNKGFEWMTSFLALLQSVKYTPIKYTKPKKDLILTQYRLKLLSILANFLTTHLMEFDAQNTSAFVAKLVSYLDQSPLSTQEQAHQEIRSMIPEAAGGEVKHLVIPYGFTLLQEITFNLLVYIQADVQSQQLRVALIEEYRSILNGLVASRNLFQRCQEQLAATQRAVTEGDLQEFIQVKRKKMSQRMMVLADCISLEEPLPEGLLEYFLHMSEVAELSAVSFRDLQNATNGKLHNNLFIMWLLHKRGSLYSESTDPHSIVLRTEFFQFIEAHCAHLMDHKYRLRDSPYFDGMVFEETQKLMENYYKLEPQLALLTKRRNAKL